MRRAQPLHNSVSLHFIPNKSAANINGLPPGLKRCRPTSRERNGARLSRKVQFNKKGKPMTEQHTLLWESGQRSAPLPPLVDPSGVALEEQPLVALYRTYGPVFRLPHPEKQPTVILAGPEPNAFMSTLEDEVL